MKNGEKNIVDKFLDGYEDLNNQPNNKVRVYQKPTKFVCIRNFILGIAILFVLLFVFGFHTSFGYILFFLADLIVVLFYGINLFTKDGVKLPTYVRVKKDEEDEDKRQ